MSKAYNGRPARKCRDCKFFNQGIMSAQCFNPSQTDENLKKYIYWDSICDLFIEGDRLTESEMNKNGFVKCSPTKETVSQEYYEKRS